MTTAVFMLCWSWRWIRCSHLPHSEAADASDFSPTIPTRSCLRDAVKPSSTVPPAAVQHEPLDPLELFGSECKRGCGPQMGSHRRCTVRTWFLMLMLGKDADGNINAKIKLFLPLLTSVSSELPFFKHFEFIHFLFTVSPSQAPFAAISPPSHSFAAAINTGLNPLGTSDQWH